MGDGSAISVRFVNGNRERVIGADWRSRPFAVYQGKDGDHNSKVWEYRGNLASGNLVPSEQSVELRKRVETGDIGVYQETITKSFRAWCLLKVKGLFCTMGDFDKADEVKLVARGTKQILLLEPAALEDVQLALDKFQADDKQRIILHIVTELLVADQVDLFALKKGGCEQFPLAPTESALPGVSWIDSSHVCVKAKSPANPIVVRRTFRRLAWDRSGNLLRHLRGMATDPGIGPEIEPSLASEKRFGSLSSAPEPPLERVDIKFYTHDLLGMGQEQEEDGTNNNDSNHNEIERTGTEISFWGVICRLSFKNPNVPDVGGAASGGEGRLT